MCPCQAWFTVFRVLTLVLLLRTLSRSGSVWVCCCCVVGVFLCVWCLWCGTLKNTCVHSKRLRVCWQNARVTQDTDVLTAHTETFRVYTRERFESTHAHTPHVPDTHTHEQLTHKQHTHEFRRRQSNTNAPNDLHESRPLAHKPPKWATSPIIPFQRQRLHHTRTHVRLSTHTTQHTTHHKHTSTTTTTT